MNRPRGRSTDESSQEETVPGRDGPEKEKSVLRKAQRLDSRGRPPLLYFFYTTGGTARDPAVPGIECAPKSLHGPLEVRTLRLRPKPAR